MPSEAALSQGDRPPQLENLTLWQRAHHHLREEILAGRLQPGTELAEVALSEQLGVSRGPIREAIGRLAAEGLVTVRPRRGVIVRSLSKGGFRRIVLVNAQTEISFGYPREELLGQSIEILVPERFRQRHSGHLAEIA